MEIKYFTNYLKEEDKTILWKEVYKNDDEVIEISLIGWGWGTYNIEDEDDFNSLVGLTATYE